MNKNSEFIAFSLAALAIIGSHRSDGGAVLGPSGYSSQGGGGGGGELQIQPEFAEPIENLTVPKGRDAVFTCRVRGLGGFRVGWVRADSKGILSIGHSVITHNPAIRVSHSSDLWHLHIKGVKEEDSGSYMCQINTDPMISQIAYLEVVIPPDFIPEETSGDIMVPEGSPVKLTCNARGFPKPKISFRREGNQNITFYKGGGQKTSVPIFEGNILKLVKISRSDMGPYLCIASNMVPPSISKRIFVSVNFPPALEIVNQLIASPLGSDVTLECNVEAFPRSIHFWMREFGKSPNTMIISGDRYEVQEITKSIFEVKMVLIIRRFRRSDAGNYHCVAKNSLGDVDSVIKLQYIETESPPMLERGGSRRGNKEDRRKNNRVRNNKITPDEDDEDEDEDDGEEEEEERLPKYPLPKKPNSKERSNQSPGWETRGTNNPPNNVNTLVVPINTRGRDYSSSSRAPTSLTSITLVLISIFQFFPVSERV